MVMIICGTQGGLSMRGGAQTSEKVVADLKVNQMCVYGKKNFMHYKNLFILGKWQVIKEDMGNSNVFYPRELDKHQRSI